MLVNTSTTVQSLGEVSLQDFQSSPLIVFFCRTLISYQNIMKSEEQFGINLVYGAAFFLKG